MNLVWHGTRTPFDTKSHYCPAVDRACHATAVLYSRAELNLADELNGFKRHASAMFKVN